MNQPRLWVSSSRPNHLVNALAAAAALRHRFSERCFIYEHSSWWENARWEEFRPAFDRVVPLERPRTCRGLFDLRRFKRDLRSRQDRIRELGAKPGDVFVCLASATGLSNAIASVYRDNAKILLFTRQGLEEASRPANFLRYRFTTSSALEYFCLQRAVGLLPTLHLKPWLPFRGDGVRLERPRQNLRDIYQSIVLWSTQGAPAPSPALGAAPSGVAPVHAAPWPRLSDFAADLPRHDRPAPAAPSRRRMVFFGTPFLLVRNLAPATYTDVLNRCLAYLRLHYGDRCRLVYRPHPAETSERDHLQLEGFEVEEDREVAELYFLKHSDVIEAVYSVSSTVSRVAFSYGFNAHVLWPCFPFHRTAAAYFRTLMDVVPAGFEIRSLDHPPVAYQPARTEAAGQSFADVLVRALDQIAPVPAVSAA